MDRETVIRIWRELPGGDIVTGSTLHRFADHIAALERERLAAWIETQRNDVPASGEEFAATIRAL